MLTKPVINMPSQANTEQDVVANLIDDKKAKDIERYKKGIQLGRKLIILLFVLNLLTILINISATLTELTIIKIVYSCLLVLIYFLSYKKPFISYTINTILFALVNSYWCFHILSGDHIIAKIVLDVFVLLLGIFALLRYVAFAFIYENLMEETAIK